MISNTPGAHAYIDTANMFMCTQSQAPEKWNHLDVIKAFGRKT